MLSVAGADHIITMDLHASQIQVQICILYFIVCTVAKVIYTQTSFPCSKVKSTGMTSF